MKNIKRCQIMLDRSFITILSILVLAIHSLDARELDDSERKDGYVALFNGKDLTGWVGDVGRYKVENGELICYGKNVFTEKEYANFVMRFEFKLIHDANNGLGIRAPLKGDVAYKGMELQILDNTAKRYEKLKEWQYHGSIYGLVAAKRGFLKPVGEWNSEEVIANGNKIKVILNGTVIVDADLSKIDNEENRKKHPGMLRKKGHIGLLGHGAPVRFRNLRIKELKSAKGIDDDLNKPPEGFVALFNGKDLTGWKGLMKRPFDNPLKRATLTAAKAKELQREADEVMRKHWKVENGVLSYDGKGRSLCTAKDYGDFEMLVDWKIGKGGDSGIYLRGAPQVQIWDNDKWKIGSGGLYNNKKHTRKPIVVADNPTGTWNSFRIKMVKDKVTVYLNDKLVTDTVMENYWKRKIPIFASGQIELQHHHSILYFRNIFIREIKK